MILISLFSGVGGFEVAADEMGWDVFASCEINPFGQGVLKNHWPNAYHHGDIHTLTLEILEHELSKRFGAHWRTDDIVLTGGFPCQPYSNAGKRLGKEDDRHLWPEYLRIIRWLKPEYIVGENVSGLVNWNGGMVFDEIQTDLETEGYEVTPFILPACGVNAPHRRDRIWFIAYSQNSGCRRRESEQRPGGERELLSRECSRSKVGGEAEGCGGEWIPSDSKSIGMERSGANREQKPRTHAGERLPVRGSSGQNWDFWPTQPPLRFRNDGFFTESLRQRIREDSMGYLSEKEIDKIISEADSRWRKETIKAAGNAIVPQVAVQIFKAIEQFKQLKNERSGI